VAATRSYHRGPVFQRRNCRGRRFGEPGTAHGQAKQRPI